MASCHLALGGNVGQVIAAFRSARRLLGEAGCEVRAVSRCYRTAAVGGAGSEFLNAAAAIETELAPEELLDRLQAIERDLGRVRTRHWGPRTIDLDLIFYADEVIASPRLTVPHPLCWFRRFVLDPLAEIAHDAVHPIGHVSVSCLREGLLERPLPVELEGEDAPAIDVLRATLSPEFPEARFGGHSGKPALIFRLAGPRDALKPPDAGGRTITLPRENPAVQARSVLQSALGECLPCDDTW